MRRTSIPRRQPHRRLDAHQVVPPARAHDRPVGLGAQCGSREPDRARDAAARARATRVPQGHVRPARLAAAPGEAGGHVSAEVRPLGEVRLPEQDRACRAQLGCDVRVARDDGAEERERAGGRVHAWKATGEGHGGQRDVPPGRRKGGEKEEWKGRWGGEMGLPSLARVAILSLRMIGMPWRGPRAPVVRRSRSSAAACLSALGFVSITARRVGPCRFTSSILAK